MVVVSERSFSFKKVSYFPHSYDMEHPLIIGILHIFDIILFLHQTTTLARIIHVLICCISFISYIKPQQFIVLCHFVNVVYHSFPTSNHNCGVKHLRNGVVVYHSFPTSNHNCERSRSESTLLYIIHFLHQTTTIARFRMFVASCISFISYIKPQRSPDCGIS